MCEDGERRLFVIRVIEDLQQLEEHPRMKDTFLYTNPWLIERSN